MSTVSVDHGGNVLDKALLSSNKCNTAHKGEEEKVANSPVKESCSDQQTETTVSRRGKRRRVECKKYTGFVVELLNKTNQSNPSNLTESFVAIDQPRLTGSVVKTKRYKQLKDEQSSEFVRNTRQRAKDRLIEDCESEKWAKCPQPRNTKIGVKKCTRPAVSSDKQRCSNGSRETKKSEAITSSGRQSDNSEKVKRKHALCAIFDNIWVSETTGTQVNRTAETTGTQVNMTAENKRTAENNRTAEKPVTNGLRELFDNIFHKVSPVRMMPVDEDEDEKQPGPRSCRDSSPPLKSPDKLERQGSANSSVVDDVSTSHLCNLPSVDAVGFEISESSLSLQVKIESSLSSEVKTDLHPPSPLNTATCEPWMVKPPPAPSLHLSQSQCEARSKHISLQLAIKKTVLLPFAVVPDHRKKRKQRCRKQKQPSHVTDADDEHSEGETSALRHFALMTGPLKNVSIEDLWMQKVFYLRYLCNYYHISNEGSKEWLVSRLHQYILQTIGGSSLTKPRNCKYKPLRRSGSPTVSWVALNVNYKIKLLE